MLKKVLKNKHPVEVDIMTHLAQQEILSDPRNRVVPLLETLPSPVDDNVTILVMPLLRPHDNPDFDTVGECIDFISQILEVGLSPLMDSPRR